MTPLAQRIGRAVHRNAPNPMCLSCLARREGVAEHDVRSAALVLIVRQGLRLVQRTCSDCHHPGEALVVQQSA